MRHRASWRWTLALFLVAILSFSDSLCLLSDLPFLVFLVAGAVALRQGKAERAARLWATTIGFSCLLIGDIAHALCDSSYDVGTGPLVVFLFFGPRTRWSTVLWGGASAAVGVPCACVLHWLVAGSVVVAATVGFALVRQALLRRTQPST
jgi:hypothetical protein